MYCRGLYPLAELAAVAGCPFHYISELGGHVPLHSETMETPLPGLFVAGNITGIEKEKLRWRKEQLQVYLSQNMQVKT